MSNTRNKTHKNNIRKKKMAFENTKASFVAGIVVIITMLNDTIDVIFAMGAIISAVVRLIRFMNRTLTERRN